MIYPMVLTANFADENLTTEELLTSLSTELVGAPHPELVKLFNHYGFTRRGNVSWSKSAVADNAVLLQAFWDDFVELMAPGTYFDNPEFRHASAPLAYSLHHRHGYIGAFRQINYFSGVNILDRYSRTTGNNTSDSLTLGLVDIKFQNGSLWFRVYPTDEVARFSDQIRLFRGINVRRSVPRFTTPGSLQSILDNLAVQIREHAQYRPEATVTLFAKNDSNIEKLQGLIQEAEKSVIVSYIKGKPAVGSLRVGTKVSPLPVGLPARITKGKEVEFKVARIEALKEKNPNVRFYTNEGLLDVSRMARSKPYRGESRLYKYQKEAVGLHLSTEIGYLQACDPGMGKTIMALTAYRERAKTIPNYRALVVCEANVRNQWAEEAEKWFPEASVLILDSVKKTKDFAHALSTPGPVLVISTYNQTMHVYNEVEEEKMFQVSLQELPIMEQVKQLTNQKTRGFTVGSGLRNTHWHDVCADESVIIRNASSKQYQALWVIRKNSDIAIAATASPLNKDISDMTHLVSWIRNDRMMFSGVDLSAEYDATTIQGAKKLFDIFGPIMYRKTKSEIQEQETNFDMPDIRKPEINFLSPNPSEFALANAAEKELKRCYLELLEAMDGLEDSSEVDQRALAEAKAKLKEARSAWLGGQQLARMAMSDPSALYESDSMGANLLIGQGLVDNALEVEPTKRKMLIERAVERVAKGEQIVVFTDFATVAKTLMNSLQENGVNAQVFSGQNSTTRDRNRVEFQKGNIDVLICTKAGERGLTLHNASAIFHYDLPWAPERIVQRVGRGARIGSKNEAIDNVFFIMKNTIEERIATKIVKLGAMSSMVLDYSRGVDVRKTQLVEAMGGLTQAVSQRTSSKEELRDFGRILLGEI